MPIYECRCKRCDLTFEVLASLKASRRAQPCPQCGRASQRVLSPPCFANGRSGEVTATTDPSRPDVTKLPVPPAARLCWMDGPSAARLAAYRHGRGAEYDDTTLSRAEAKKRRGESPEATSTAGHSDTPLKDPAIFARRRDAAARRIKAAESKDSTHRPRSSS
jgi:putative FmdB family regulatory protein